MADEIITTATIEQYKDQLPPELAEALARARTPIKVEELFPTNIPLAQALREKGVAEVNNTKFGVITDSEGYVTAVAARISRTPSKSYDIVSDIGDFSITSTEDRDQKIQLFTQIYHKEGIVNNAINKTAALVSADGSFHVQRARKGNRKVTNVEEELMVLLNYWIKNVNARGMDSAVTGARGLAAVISQATRQALIEGSWIGYSQEKQVDVPSLGKRYTLPMFLQTMSTRYIIVPDGLVGTGLELFYWKPPRSVVNSIINPKDKDLQKVYNDAFTSDTISQLKKNGQVLLEKERVYHVKHRGLETEAFGESFIEPTIADLAYKRALQALDYVIVESMINRILIIKVGSDKPDSMYHNLEFAQKRLALLERMFDTVDPSMTILWAGPDIDVVDVGVHGQLPDLGSRYDFAGERLIYSLGVPIPLLVGDAQGQVWAGYEGYKETLRELQNSFAQVLVSIGERIAATNGYEGVELIFEFDRAVLADQNAAADLALRTRKAGLSSIRKAISDLGGDFDSERRNRLIERGYDPDATDIPTDEELFEAPRGLPGDTGVDMDGNVSDPGGDGGRPPDSQREDLAPERDREQRSRQIPRENLKDK